MNEKKNVAISDDLLREVEEVAREEGKTPGEVVEEATRQLLKRLRTGTEHVPADEKEPRGKFADFSSLVGKWEPDPEFDEILAAQRQIDPDLWK
jgi:hypothetical protein